jgi:hypothetical protein
MIYGLSELAKNLGPLYDCGYFTPKAKDTVMETMKVRFKEIRP